MSIGWGFSLTLFTLTGMLVTVEHVTTGDLLLAGAHQGQFDLILNLFDVQGAAGRQATLEDGADGVGHLVYCLANARGGGGLITFYGEKRLGHGNADFIVGIRYQGAVAFDHAQLAGRAHVQVVLMVALCMHLGGGCITG